MTKKEMAEKLREWCSTVRKMPYVIGGNEPVVQVCSAAAEALEREAAAEAEKERPSLQEQITACLSAAGFDPHRVMLNHAKAAAETLTRLREEGRVILDRHIKLPRCGDKPGRCICDPCNLLRSLGVEATK